MAMRALREGTSGGFLKYILFALLGMAVGGLMLMDVGGFFSGGVSNTDVASIGGQKIKANQFHRDLQQNLRRVGLTPDQAYQLGYIDQILAARVRNAILEQEARKNGLQVSKDAIANQIQQLVTPMANQDMSPQDVFKQILRSQGMSEGEFVRRIGNEQAQAYLTSALQAGFADISKDLVIDIYRGQNETRTIEFISFPHKDVTGIEAPTDEQLQTLYAVTKDQQFAIPETRILQVGILDDAKLREKLVISDEEIQTIYENNIEAYTIPDSRILKQALVDSKDQAEQIYNLTEKGKALQESVQEVTGSAIAYLGQELFRSEDIMEDIKPAVLSAEKEGTVLEPIQTPLGWNVTVVEKIQKETVQPLEDVSAIIRKELQDDQLYDQVYDLSTQIDDMLASGMTLEEIAGEAEIKLVTLPPMNQLGSTEEENSEALKSIEGFKDQVVQLGFSLQENETSAVSETDNGGYIAVAVQQITPKSYQPFEAVKQQLSEKWYLDQKMLKNAQQLGESINPLQAGELSFAAFAKQEGKPIQRKENIDRKLQSSPLTYRAVQMIFETPPQTPVVIEIEGGLAVAQVESFNWPEVGENEADGTEVDLKTLELEMTRQMQDSAIQLYIQAKEPEYNVQVNQQLLQQMYGQSQPSF